MLKEEYMIYIRWIQKKDGSICDGMTSDMPTIDLIHICITLFGIYFIYVLSLIFIDKIKDRINKKGEEKKRYGEHRIAKKKI